MVFCNIPIGIGKRNDNLKDTNLMKNSVLRQSSLLQAAIAIGLEFKCSKKKMFDRFTTTVYHRCFWELIKIFFRPTRQKFKKRSNEPRVENLSNFSGGSLILKGTWFEVLHEIRKQRQFIIITRTTILSDFGGSNAQLIVNFSSQFRILKLFKIFITIVLQHIHCNNV